MAQLNPRQLDVLRWIGDGCPDRDWPGQSHKLTARSLAGKDLADVWRKKKTWTATITAAGQYYLEHGKPPPSREPDFELTARGDSRDRESGSTSRPTNEAPPGLPLGQAETNLACHFFTAGLLNHCPAETVSAAQQGPGGGPPWSPDVRFHLRSVHARRAAESWMGSRFCDGRKLGV